MVVAVTAVAWLVHRLRAEDHGAADQWVPFSPVLLALAVLGAVLGAAFVLRLVAGRKRTAFSEPSPAEAPAGQSPD